MDRELLIEIGCEEIPAAWLPGLTAQLAQHLDARLKEFRLTTAARAESYSTPRRLTARVAKLAERQTDFEEVVTGPPIAAAFKANGEAAPAAVGFARKYGVDVSALERHETPKGTYLAYRVRQRGKATSDVLADVTGRLLRDLTFPQQMRWDAHLEDGKGELVFARPIRWLVLMYGGRVVPFVIRRSELAQGPNVQDIRSGSQTYGHRFLTTSGRAGRAIKIKTFEDYQARLLENFVILDRAGRESRIRRELEIHARRLGGRVSGLVAAQSSLLREVPDLVEYPSVVAGHFSVEFLQLPEEVLTTTMIRHQHYFPVVDEEGKLKPAFLAVVNTQPEKPEIIARNAERVLAARLRDARFFWDEDRKATLESRLPRLSTILFHKKLGSYREKAERVASLARWIAEVPFAQAEPVADQAALAGRLSKADLATDMVRELTELQGTMGGIYARADGLPEQVWKAIYFHYLPVGVEADAPPSRKQLGVAAVTWAAVSLADKIDTVVSMYAAGERPTGSRDPYGLRRAALGAVRILADLPELAGITREITFRELFDAARKPFLHLAGHPGVELSPGGFWQERLRYLFEQRGFDVRNIRAVTASAIGPEPGISPTELDAPLRLRRKLDVLPEFTESADFRQLALAFKRLKNIAKELPPPVFEREEREHPDLARELKEPAERELLAEIDRCQPLIDKIVASGEGYRQGFAIAAAFGPAIDRFFKEVFVMTDDERLRTARLRVVSRLRDVILQLADISEIVSEGS